MNRIEEQKATPSKPIDLEDLVSYLPKKPNLSQASTLPHIARATSRSTIHKPHTQTQSPFDSSEILLINNSNEISEISQWSIERKVIKQGNNNSLTTQDRLRKQIQKVQEKVANGEARLSVRTSMDTAAVVH